MTQPEQQYLSRRERRAAERATEPTTATDNVSAPSAFGASAEPARDTAAGEAAEAGTIEAALPHTVSVTNTPTSLAKSGELGDAADVFFQEAPVPAQVLANPLDSSAPSIASTPEAGAEEAAASFFASTSSSPVSAPSAPAAAVAPPMPVPPKKQDAPITAPEPSKGVNLFAAISMTAVLVSVVMMFTPQLSFVAAYASYVAVPLALIAIVLPGFKRLQSIVAVVLAIAIGGWNAYNEFIVPEQPADAVIDETGEGAGPLTPGVYTFLVDGEGAGSVVWTVEGPVDELEAEMPDRQLPVRAPILVADVYSATVTLTVTAPNASNVTCRVAEGPVDVVAAQANEDGVAVCVIEPRERAADVEDSGDSPAEDLLEQIEG